jgi:heme-degrading monooxygenase HmoA
MFVILWEFEVKPGSEERFERVYGPGGDWDSLFRHDSHHAGTHLWRDTSRPSVYLTADYWHSRAAYDAFLTAQESAYKSLDAATQELTTREQKIGAYEQVGQGPASKSAASQKRD